MKIRKIYYKNDENELKEPKSNKEKTQSCDILNFIYIIRGCPNLLSFLREDTEYAGGGSMVTVRF